jgi:pyridoxine kinase
MTRRRNPPPHIIALSSYVAHGSVGLRAVMALGQATGAKITALPSVVLSNHLGYDARAKQSVEVSALEDMLNALTGNGATAHVDGVLIGYLPSAAHVAFAAHLIDEVKAFNPACTVLVDPVMGDDPGGFYVEASVSDAIRDTLVRRADVITPNRFELAFLSGATVADSGSAITAGRTLAGTWPVKVFATSIPAGPQHLSNLSLAGASVHRATTPKADRAPHGTGDLFAASVLLNLLDGASDADALKQATSTVRHVLTHSTASRELALERLDRDAIDRLSTTVETLA